jgi:hypothetical protein
MKTYYLWNFIMWLRKITGKKDYVYCEHCGKRYEKQS